MTTSQLSMAKGRSAASTKRPKLWKKPKYMPKRPLSAYNLFFAEERKRLLNQDPNTSIPPKKLGFVGLTRAVALKWKSIDSIEKVKFQNQAIVDRNRYKLEMEEWEQRVASFGQGVSDAKCDHKKRTNGGELHSVRVSADKKKLKTRDISILREQGSMETADLICEIGISAVGSVNDSIQPNLFRLPFDHLKPPIDRSCSKARSSDTIVTESSMVSLNQESSFVSMDSTGTSFQQPASCHQDRSRSISKIQPLSSNVLSQLLSSLDNDEISFISNLEF